MIEASKIIQAIAYILGKIKRADKIQLVKLLFIADKYHLIRYGRTITNDQYWAVKAGPMGSNTRDILGLDDEYPSPESEYTSQMIQREGMYGYKLREGNKPEFYSLSETDLEILDVVIGKFGQMDKWVLVEYTHRYPEWAQYQKLFEANQIKREKIETDELLSKLGDEPFEITEDDLKESREILTGTFD